MQAETQTYLVEVIRLMTLASTGAMPLQEFEKCFLELYVDLPEDVPTAELASLEDVFWGIESFVAQPELRRPSDIDETELINVILRALGELGHGPQAS